MTNTTELRKRIKDSGLKLGFIAERLGISYHWLNMKIDGKVPFKDYEIQILCELLNITDLNDKEFIFFAVNVEENSTPA